MALILVIDDRATMRKLVRRMPVRADHAVVDAEDGEAGLAAFERHQPDVVITDLLMPKKEGIETIRQVRRLQPSARVIAMSGGDEINLQSARKLGADEILAKPFEMAVLLDMVNRMLGIERESHRNNRGVTSGPTRPAAEASSREPTAPSLMPSPVQYLRVLPNNSRDNNLCQVPPAWSNPLPTVLHSASSGLPSPQSWPRSTGAKIS